jgi:hypothetical protein
MTVLAPADTALVRRIALTGWSTIALGAVCVGLGALQAVIPALLARLDTALDGPDDPTQPLREAFASGAGTSAAVNAIFGAALVVIGIGVVRRSAWSRGALEAACWASIAVLALLAKPSLAPIFAWAGAERPAGSGLIVTSLILIVAQVVAVLWFLKFWRTPGVRAAFRRDS